MASQVGYQLIKLADNSVIESWGGVYGQCPAVPGRIVTPAGDDVHCPAVGINYNGYQLSPWMLDPPPPSVPTCQLWQLEAVMGPTQWAAAQAAVTALNNPVVTAFFNHGTNVIPANSATLLSLGAALGLTADQVTALVTSASAVSIP